jgi:hypothetical protein
MYELPGDVPKVFLMLPAHHPELSGSYNKPCGIFHYSLFLATGF